MFVFSLLTVYSVIPPESANIGLIIGIAVGCVVAVVLLLTVTTVLIIVCYKKNQKCQPESDCHSETKDVSPCTVTYTYVYVCHTEIRNHCVYMFKKWFT